MELPTSYKILLALLLILASFEILSLGDVLLWGSYLYVSHLFLVLVNPWFEMVLARIYNPFRVLLDDEDDEGEVGGVVRAANHHGDQLVDLGDEVREIEGGGELVERVRGERG